MKLWIVPLFAALLVLGVSHVAAAQSQGQGQGQGQGKEKHYDEPNHGQVVSECNHRANSRNLKGQERKDFTEWCESRGARYKYDDNRYGNERDCYQKANKKGLAGNKRANFLDKCLAETDSKYYGGKVPVQQKKD
ncbi:MAG: PsiF family protein [Steroidobacteraceae bacterium]|nr:PsiF family protein [Steroidobacteraceae bacterium]